MQGLCWVSGSVVNDSRPRPEATTCRAHIKRSGQLTLYSCNYSQCTLQHSERLHVSGRKQTWQLLADDQ